MKPGETVVTLPEALSRDSPSPRVRVWTYAWALAFLHFFARAFENHTGFSEKVIESIDLGSVQLSGIVFLSSVAFENDNRRKRFTLLLLVAIPMVLHPFFFTLHLGMPWAPAGLIALVFVGGAAFALKDFQRRPLSSGSMALALIALGLLSSYEEELRHDPWFASAAILAMTFGLSGMFFWRLYQRYSLGVMTTTAGFIGWGAVYPMGVLLHMFVSNIQPSLDFWNVPRILVTLGMVLTLLEDQSFAVKQSSVRARAENLLLHRLSQITSRLLAGSDPRALCGEAVCAITEASSFRRAAIPGRRRPQISLVWR